MKARTGVLDRPRARILRELGPWATKGGYYLAGGTALALHFGHRTSVDFDWFGPDPILDPARLVADLEELAGSKFVPLQPLEPGTVVGGLRGVKVSFFRYHYALLHKRILIGSSALASPIDLAAMKLAAIYDRSAKRDFVDLYVLGHEHAAFATLVTAFAAKFPEGSLTHLRRALLSFAGAEDDPMPPMLGAYRGLRWPVVKRWIEEQVTRWR